MKDEWNEFEIRKWISHSVRHICFASPSRRVEVVVQFTVNLY